MSYLGIDIGTTGCKATAFGRGGRQLATSYMGYEVISPRPGWAELDSENVLECCLQVIRGAASACSQDPVRAIGVSSQGEAFTPVGADGHKLANAMVSSDARATMTATNWSESFGRERLYRITGHTPSPMFTLFKLLWLKEHAPEVFSQARVFYCFEELLHYRLGVDPAISWPLAGRTMMFDVLKHAWSDEILDAAGIEKSKLARALPSGSVVGTIPDSVCRHLSLPCGTFVVTGGHDQPCGALGAGVFSGKKAVYSIGTVECITPAFDTPAFSNELFINNLCTYDYAINGMYTTVAYSLTGGNLLKWFRDQFGRAEVEAAECSGEDAYETLLASMPSIPSDLLVLPYFTPSGTPYFETRTPAVITGLRLTTTRGQVLRGLLEGVTYEMRLNLETLRGSGMMISELIAIGGGAKSERWLQLKADILGIPIRKADVTESGCLGAAMLAMAADTGEDLRKIAQELVRLANTIDPNPQNTRVYDEKFNSYLDLYPAMKTFTKKQSTEVTTP